MSLVDYKQEMVDIAHWLLESGDACRDASVIVDTVACMLEDLQEEHEKLLQDFIKLKNNYALACEKLKISSGPSDETLTAWSAAYTSAEDLARVNKIIDYLMGRCLVLEEEVMRLVELNKYLAHNPGENYEQEVF